MTGNVPGEKNNKQVLQRIGTLVLLGIAVYLLLPQIATLENSWNVLKKMTLWAVGLAFLAQVLSYLSSGFLMQKTLAITLQSVSWMRSTLIVLGSASIGMVAGGTLGSSAAIYHWTSADSGNLEGATLASFIPSLFNNLILVLLSVFGLVHLIVSHDLSRTQLIGFSAALVLIGMSIAAAVLAVRHRDQATNFINRVGNSLAKRRHKDYDLNSTRMQINNIFTAWDNLWLGKWFYLAVGALMNIVFDMLTLYFLFMASGETISIGVLLSGYALPLLIGKVAFVIPGGVGVIETSMAALYSGLGVPNGTAVVVVLGYRLISFWIPSIAGFPTAAYLQRSVQKPQAQSSPESKSG
ncbi:MAG: YbhN family protein [Anaerolineaceae bacterium]